uniref:Uncharacterized protein n=1 Tax=Ignisphaera aggregans TaxID=334771 RepID=A0A7C2V8T6_9CREN
MIEERNIPLLISTAYAAPYISADSNAILDNEVVFKIVDMYVDEVVRYIKINGIKTVQSSHLKEDAYVLCGDSLIHVGTFSGGFIPSQNLLKFREACRSIVMLHTHPVPLPIPTLEDIVSMYQIGYGSECVLSRIHDGVAKMVCVEPFDYLENVMRGLENFSNEMFKLVDRYVVIEDEYGVFFLPYPSKRNLEKIEEEFVMHMKRTCRINIVSLDMERGEYDLSVFP